MWFVKSINNDPGSYGVSLQTAQFAPGEYDYANGITIADNTFSYGSGSGARSVLAHELGHNLGLNHTTFGAVGTTNIMTSGSTIPSSVSNIYPDGSKLCYLNSSQITMARSTPFAVSLPVGEQFVYPKNPSFLTQPSSQSSSVGSNATFTNSVDGSLPLYFQWRLNGVILSGKTNQTLIISNIQNADAGDYTLVVTNEGGSVTSQVATLSISGGGLVTPTITWANPANIIYGTALSGTQLNASAGSVAGTFAYTPISGTVLNAGNNQMLTAVFTPSDMGSYNMATQIVTINVLKAIPTITWSNPANITYPTVLDGTQLNASANVPGSFAYTPITGTVLNAGNGQTLSTTFTPTDTANYSNATKNVFINVIKAAATVSLSNLSFVYDGTAKSATVGTTPSSLATSVTYNGSGTTPTAAGSYTVVATITDPNYSGSATDTLVISKATPSVTWNNPADITYPTALSVSQLNASPNVAGTFAYSPAIGTTMNAGSNQTLTAIFTASDSNYNKVTNTVQITVLKGNVTINLGNLTQSFDGTARSVSVTTTPPGVATAVTYDGSTSAPTIVGSYTVIGTSTDANYNPSSATNTLVISKGTPVITWSNPSSIVYGTALSGSQLNASANVPGSFVYTPSSGTVLGVGSNQVLSTTFTPTDAVNYSNATKTVQINVSKAPATVNLSGLVYVYDGAAKQVSVTTTPTSLPTTITYNASPTPPSAAGSYTVVATVNHSNYVGSATNTMVIYKATPTITWANPAEILTGTSLSSVQLNASANVAGSFAYTPTSGTVLSVGSNQVLSTTFTPTDTANYSNATKTVLINVTTIVKTVPAIGWTNPASIIYGTVLSGIQLNATSSVPGAFVYTPSAGTVLSAGSNQTLGLSFTPTDTTNYAVVNTNVSITVLKAAGAVTLGSTNQVYDGSPRNVTISTTPSGLGTVVTYNGSSIVPTTAGSYTVFATISDINYEGLTSGTLNISKATPSLILTGLSHVYDGSAKSAIAQTTPSGLVSIITYNGSSTAPATAGVYTVVATVNDPNYNAVSTTNLMTISPANSIPVLSGLSPVYDGTAKSVGVTTVPPGLAVNVTYVGLAGPPTNAGSYTVIATINDNNYTGSVTNTLVIDKATASIVLAGLNPVYDGSPKVPTVSTTPSGLTTVLTYNDSSTAPFIAGTFTVKAIINTTNYKGGVTNNMTIAKATPSIVWAKPADIAVGTALGVLQLNAAANVPGAYAYSPPSGTVLSLGSNQVLSVVFTPTDTANYNAASNTVLIDVLNVIRTAPVLGWTNPASIIYGTVLSSLQLNATSSVPGSFAYAPAAGTILNAGSNQTLSVTFTPSNTTAYLVVSTNVQISVLKATPPITWTNPAPITYGTALGSNQLNASASILGSFAYVPSAGALLSAGTGQVLTVTFTPASLANHTTASATVRIDVTKAVPTIIWTNPPSIPYPTPLGPDQLNATSPVAGNFVYTPPAGTILNAGGGQPLNTVFSPTDTSNYTNALKTVYITITKGVPQVNWPQPSDIAYGTPLGSNQLNATATIPGTFTYTPAAGSLLLVGSSRSLRVSFRPDDTANYASATIFNLINVTQAVPVIVWNNPTDIEYGTALSALQLNATSAVPGVFTYNPSAGTQLPVGSNQLLGVSFSPTDTVSYLSAAATARINVLKANAAITLGGLTQMYDGDAKSVSVNTTPAGLAHAITYDGASSAPTNAGKYAVSVTINDSNYKGTTTNILEIAKATATINITNATVVYDGTAKSLPLATVPSGLASIVTYNGASDLPVSAGNYTVVAVITNLNYTGSSTGALTILKATPVVQWTNPVLIVYGTALGSAQLNASASVPGTIAYSPTNGAMLSAGTNQILSAFFMPTDAVNYSNATKTVMITVLKASPGSALTASTNLAQLWQTVTFTNRITSPASISSTGTVAFITNGVSAGTPLAMFAGQSVYSTANLKGGTNIITAAFSGDENLNPVTNSISLIVNCSPVAMADTNSTLLHVPLSIPTSLLLTNDYDPDGNNLTVSFIPTKTIANGALVLSNNVILYSPATNFVGVDSFVYVISDGFGGTNSAIVSISVESLCEIKYTGNRVTLSLFGEPDVVLLVQRSVDLQVWQNISTNIISSSGTSSFTDFSTPKDRAFYRILKQ